MAEMEDKFQEILGNEAAMSQIMSIAQSLSSPGGASGEEAVEASTSWAPVAQGESFSLESLMGGLDPGMMALGMRLISAYQQEHHTVGLMESLRPFVKEERHVMMDKMSQATKIAKVLCSMLEAWGENRGDHGV